MKKSKMIEKVKADIDSVIMPSTLSVNLGLVTMDQWLRLCQLWDTMKQHNVKKL